MTVVARLIRIREIDAEDDGWYPFRAKPADSKEKGRADDGATNTG